MLNIWNLIIGEAKYAILVSPCCKRSLKSFINNFLNVLQVAKAMKHFSWQANFKCLTNIVSSIGWSLRKLRHCSLWYLVIPVTNTLNAFTGIFEQSTNRKVCIPTWIGAGGKTWAEKWEKQFLQKNKDLMDWISCRWKKM